MPNPNTPRRADTLVEGSSRGIGSKFKLIAIKQVKLWHAFVLSMFIAGFAAAFTWVVSEEYLRGKQDTVFSESDAACPDGFFDNYDDCRETSSSKKIGCATLGISTLSKPLQGKAVKSEAHNASCSDTNRGYYNYSIFERLPALVMVWVRVEAASWDRAVGDRFSPLTIKEDPAEGKECETKTLTTHILKNGTLDIGHSRMSYRSTAVTANLNKWDLHSVFLERGTDGQTHVTLWLNGDIAVQGTTNNAFIEDGTGVIHSLHAGMYGDNNDMVLYNDEFSVISGIAGGITEAAQLVSEQLGGLVQTQPNVEYNDPGSPPECMDGYDNDGDEQVDLDDQGCDCAIDDEESIRPLAECGDGIDNDNDGKCDVASATCADGSIPKDTGCTGVNDESEQSGNLSSYPAFEFTANPNEILDANDTVSLVWKNVKNATSCTASGGTGDWSGSKTLSGGSQDVSPDHTTYYLLTCKKGSFSRTRLATVYVGTGGPPPVDRTPPTRSSGSPAGTLPSGTTSAILSLSTNENATCKYSTAAAISYASMTNMFSTTGNTSHSNTLSGLTDGSSHSYYIRCQDDSNNSNSDDFVISFFVSSSTESGDPVFQESGGQVVIEAEHFDTNTPRVNHSWEPASSVSGASSNMYMLASPDGSAIDNSNPSGNTELTYRVNFSTPGMYYVWVRGRGPDGNGDSIHAGVDGAALSTSVDMADSGWRGKWYWSKKTSTGTANITVSAGEHTIHLWMREDGFMADKIFLTTSSFNTAPSGTGPAESPRR